MMIKRANPLGGHPLKQGNFPLHQDKNGDFGFLIGYMQDGEKVLIKISDAEMVANAFASELHGFHKKFKQVKPHVPLKKKLAIWLLSKKEVRELEEQRELGD